MAFWSTYLSGFVGGFGLALFIMARMALAESRHRRFCNTVLDTLRHRGSMSGRELRTVLADNGLSFSLAGFYSRMARLEDTGLIRGWNDTIDVEGVELHPRCYAMTHSWPWMNCSRPATRREP